jgi:hypothetical protein
VVSEFRKREVFKKGVFHPTFTPLSPYPWLALRRRVRSVLAGEPDILVRTFSTRYSTANSTLPPQAARFGRCWRRSSRLRCQALAEHAAPNASIRASTAGRLRFAFLTSPLVHEKCRFQAPEPSAQRRVADNLPAPDEIHDMVRVSFGTQTLIRVPEHFFLGETCSAISSARTYVRSNRRSRRVRVLASGGHLRRVYFNGLDSSDVCGHRCRVLGSEAIHPGVERLCEPRVGIF